MIRIHTPKDLNKLKSLRAGDEILLSAAIFTFRDASCGNVLKDKKFDFKNKIIYFCGPTPAPKGKVIGSCGPTTTRRMDRFIPGFLKSGLAAFIGKGDVCGDVVKAIKKYKGVYLLAIGGAGALISRCVASAEVFRYKELGPEAIYRLEVEDFHLIVGIDSTGRSIYASKD